MMADKKPYKLPNGVVFPLTEAEAEQLGAEPVKTDKPKPEPKKASK
jgi:hypothetical protein